MKKEYLTPEAEIVALEAEDVVLYSLPTETGNQLPILTRKVVTDELSGDPNLDPEDQLIDPTEYEL